MFVSSPSRRQGSLPSCLVGNVGNVGEGDDSWGKEAEEVQPSCLVVNVGNVGEGDDSWGKEAEEVQPPPESN